MVALVTDELRRPRLPTVDGVVARRDHARRRRHRWSLAPWVGDVQREATVLARPHQEPRAQQRRGRARARRRWRSWRGSGRRACARGRSRLRSPAASSSRTRDAPRSRRRARPILRCPRRRGRSPRASGGRCRCACRRACSGMKSFSTTRPLAVRSSVRSTMVSSTYSSRLARLDGAQPPGTAGFTQDAGEAGGRIERREAGPVDRSVTRDERRSLTVREQRVVRDARHAVSYLAFGQASQRVNHSGTRSADHTSLPHEWGPTASDSRFSRS